MFCKPFRACLSLTLAAALAVTPITAWADTAQTNNVPKEEVIYVNLNSDGSVDQIYVVNQFQLTEETTVEDYGHYSSVRNLTTTDPITLEGDRITFQAPAGKFYYQGNLESKNIPWDISVTYALDGKPITGEELAGTNGHLEMTLSFAPAPGSDPIYSDHFALQVTVTMDSERCTGISAPNATLANVGSDKQMSYIILPGKSKSYTISADVTDFEMSGIQINGIPLQLDIDDPDTSEIKDKIYELQDGAVELDDGAVRLDDGAAELYDGITQLQDGSEDLTDGAEELYDGAKDLQTAVRQLRNGSAQIAEKGGELSDGFGQLIQNTPELKEGIASFQDQTAGLLTLAGVSVQLPQAPEEDPLNTQVLLQRGAVLDQALESLLEQLSRQKTEPVPGASHLAVGASSVEGSSRSLLDSLLPQLLSQMRQLNTLLTGTLQYVAGTEALEAGYRQFYPFLLELDGGLGQLSGGTGDLKSGSKKLYDGSSELKDGADQLKDGAALLRDGTIQLTDGTLELRDQSLDMEDEVDDRIDEILDEYRTADFTPVSFVSSKNTQVQEVQFAMKTPDIEKEETAVEDVSEQTPQTLWERILNLFGLFDGSKREEK